MVSTITQNCAFETGRLQINGWHSSGANNWPSADLIEAVISILTPAVTRSLPPGWQGDYTTGRAKRWIEERDAESTVLGVVERASGQTIGLMLLAEGTMHGGDATEIRLGYLLAEAAWRQGFASEMVSGFVEWCRKQPEKIVVLAGVEADNLASIRVLEKCGFAREMPKSGRGEQLYRLVL